jgi:HEAT repeat protein
MPLEQFDPSGGAGGGPLIGKVADVSGPSSAQRRRSAALAGHTGDTDTARAALTDVDAPVRIAALRSLARLAELTDEHLSAALSDPDPSVRITALDLSAPRASPPIAALLDDDDAMVVEIAAWALGERSDPDPTVIDRLAEIAGDHADPLAREAAVAALGAIGDPRGLPAVLAATGDKPAVRRRAVVALSAFEGPAVDAAWARARTDRDRQVRDAVDELLGPVDGSD